jgi:hypothetical protein
MAGPHSTNLLHNNVPEVLRLALHEPVTVVQDGRQIACIVSLADFAEAGGEVALLDVEPWNERTRAMHEFGHGAADDRVQRFARLILHAAHSRHFAPLMLNGRIVAVVIPPLSPDRTALPSGPWITLDAELTPGTGNPAEG